MADRTVVVRLMAMTSQFTSGMSRAGMSVNEVTAAMKAAEGQAAKLGGAVTAASNKTTAASNKMGASFRGAVATGVVVGLGMAIKATADFDSAMSKVGAVADASAGQMQQLRTAALEMGPAFGFSAKTAAGAQEELAKAGLKVNDILGGGMQATMALAAAGDLALADASKIAAVAMNQFHLAASDLPHVADLLARGANKALGDVSDLGVAFRYMGPEAHALGVSVDDVVGSLALLAQNGLQADMAGTSLRGTIMALSSPSKMAEKAMAEYGITIFDTQGKFIGLAGMADQLQAAFGGLSDAERQHAMGRIFANAQMQAAQILTTEGGAAVRQWTRDVQTGASATDVAATKLDNLSGDVRKLGGAIQADMIGGLEGATPLLRDLTQGATGLAHAWGGLSAPMQATALGLAGMAIFGRRVGDSFGASQGKVKAFAVSFREAAEAQKVATRAAQEFQNFTAARKPSDTALLSRGGGVGGRAAYQFQARELRLTAAAAQATSSSLTGLGATYGRVAGQFSATSGALASSAVALRGVGMAAKAAGVGLMGALGGPWGLAVTGAIVGLGLLADAHSRAAASEAQQKQAVADLSQALADSNGVITEAIRKSTAYELSQKGALGIAAKMGLPLSEVTDAANNQGHALDNLRTKLQAYIDAADPAKLAKSRMPTYADIPGEQVSLDESIRRASERLRIESEAEQGITKAQSERAAQARELLSLMPEVAGAHKQAADAAKLQAEATKQTGTAAATAGPSLADLAGAAKNAGDAAGDAAEEVLSFKKAWDSLFGGQLSFHEAQTESVKQLGELTKSLKENGKAFTLNTEKGRANRDMLDQQIEFSGKLGEAASNNARDMGASEESALAAGRKATLGFLESVRNRLKAQGALTKGLDDYIKSYMAIPAAVPGAAPDAPVIKPKVDFSHAQQAMRAFGMELTKAPKGIRVTADTKEAMQELGVVWSDIEQTREGKFTAVVTNAGQIAAIMDEIAKRREPLFHGIADTSEAAKQLDLTAAERRALLLASASTGAAESVLDAAARTRNVTFHVSWAIDRQPGVQPGGGSGLDKSRWGNVYGYASGGIAAKVAGPGTIYQWAEPETGGEAFIPRRGNPSRSKAILDTAAGWYGMRVSPMAQGGITSFATGGISAPLSEMLSRFTSTAVTKEDFDAAGKKRLDAIAAVQKAERALNAVKANGKHTTRQLLDAEAALAKQRRNLTAVASAYNKASTGYAISKKPKWEQFRGAVALGVKNTNSFLWALKLLGDRGYGQLASQLLEMGGPDAEAIAQGAVKASDSALKGTAYKVGQSINQQKAIANFPAMLAVRSALKSGTSYGKLVGSGQVTAESLNAALAMMQSELGKTAAGKAMLAAMGGANAQALKADMARFATGGIASEGTLYRYAEPGTGGEAVIPRFGSNGPAVLRKAAAWHGMSVGQARPWDNVMQRAGAGNVQITVRGEGVLSGMIEATVDGRMVAVARAVRHGSRG